MSMLWRAMKAPALRQAILFACAMVLIYRIGAHIPAVGVDMSALKDSTATDQGILNLLNTFSGGAIERLSFFALGVIPYITASIAIQLGAVVFPPLYAASKDGEAGQMRMKRWTRYLAVVLGGAQAMGYTFAFKESVIDGWGPIAVIVSLTVGCAVVIWIAETITKRGVGNGISVLLLASLLTGLPGQLERWWISADPVTQAIVPIVIGGLLWAIIIVTTGERRLPVHLSGGMQGRRQRLASRTYMPLKVTTAGVLPVIFATTLMAIPATIAQFSGAEELALTIGPSSWFYVIGEALLIIGFAFLYVAVLFDPLERAEELKAAGSYVPGVRPGAPTANLMDAILSRLTLSGALFLAFIAVLPAVVAQFSAVQVTVGGTALLIAVGVILEVRKDLKSRLGEAEAHTLV